MEYEKIIANLSEIIPEACKNKPVEEHYYKHPFLPFELNIDPYKNNGKILPDEYQYYSNKHGYYFDTSKGEQYFAKILGIIDRYQEYHVLAPFLLYCFLRDFPETLGETKEIYSYRSRKKKKVMGDECEKLFKRAEEEIKKERYELVKPQCKRIFPLYSNEDSYNVYKDKIRGHLFESEKELAEVIAELTEAIMQDYKMEYWRYPDSECMRAQDTIRKAQNMAFENMMSEAEKRFGRASDKPKKLFSMKDAGLLAGRLPTAPNFKFATCERENQLLRRHMMTLRLMMHISKNGYEPFISSDILNAFLSDTVLDDYLIDYDEIVEVIQDPMINGNVVEYIEYKNGEYGEGLYYKFSDATLRELKYKSEEELDEIFEMFKRFEEVGDFKELLKEAISKEIDQMVDSLSPSEKDELLKMLLKQAFIPKQ